MSSYDSNLKSFRLEEIAESEKKEDMDQLGKEIENGDRLEQGDDMNKPEMTQNNSGERKQNHVIHSCEDVKRLADQNLKVT